MNNSDYRVEFNKRLSRRIALRESMNFPEPDNLTDILNRRAEISFYQHFFVLSEMSAEGWIDPEKEKK